MYIFCSVYSVYMIKWKYDDNEKQNHLKSTPLIYLQILCSSWTFEQNLKAKTNNCLIDI